MKRNLKIIAYSLVLMSSLAVPQTRDLGGTGEFMDSIAAIVNDGVVLRSEVETQLGMIIATLEKQGGQIPPVNTIREEVLERLIVQRLQLQRADRYGIRVSDEALNAAIANVAKNNDVSFEEFPKILDKEGINYNDYRNELRQQITIEQLRQREVISRIAVSESELDNFLIFQKDQDRLNYEYDLSHILIPVSSRAGDGEINNKQDLINELYEEIIDGKDFDDVAVEFSKGQQALSGGRLGWLKGEQLPDVFVRVASELKNGELSLPFETSSGFHLIKLNAVKGNEPILEEQIKVRHILIKTNEVLDDSAAEEKLKTIRQQIIDEGNFGAVAAAVSEDSGSAQDGGDMGWATRNFFVPEFEEIAYSLEENEISQPFRSRYGWHIIEYLGKRIFDNTEEIQKRKAISSIRNSKLSSEIEIWASELRDEAFVEKLPYN
jgi:peptidyl-prolyl cis-trans isomerase SurA